MPSQFVLALFSDARNASICAARQEDIRDPPLGSTLDDCQDGCLGLRPAVRWWLSALVL